MIFERKDEHSKTPTWVVLVPAMALITLFTYLTFWNAMEMGPDGKRIGVPVVTTCWVLFVYISWSVADRKFQAQARKVFAEATPVVKAISSFRAPEVI